MTAERPLGSRRIYEGRVISLRTDDVELRSGQRAVREIVEHRGAVAMVPLINGDVMLVRQFRAAVGRALLEIPAGSLEPGESVESCLQRELAEEIGMRAGRTEHLITFYPSPGFLTEAVHVYAARDLVPHRPTPKKKTSPSCGSRWRRRSPWSARGRSWMPNPSSASCCWARAGMRRDDHRAA